MSELDNLVQMALVTNRLREPVLRRAVQSLRLPLGSRGLDAGCGIGLQTIMLADAMGAAGHVTGLDLAPEMLAYAEDLKEQAGLSDRISLREGNVQEIPFADDAFDWAWSVDCVGYAPMEPSPLIKELVRVVKPGGTVAILAWSHETLLPGYPLLEARLAATSAGIAPFVKGKRPDWHFLRALGWFRDAGLDDCSVQTFVGDACAPLTDDLRDALTALFEMRWPSAESELAQEDRAAYHRLCLPESSDFIVDHPDYYAFFTYSMFRGKVRC